MALEQSLEMWDGEEVFPSLPFIWLEVAAVVLWAAEIPGMLWQPLDEED